MRIKNHSTKKLEVVAAFVLKNDKLLAALRSPSMSSPNLWELPGGKVESGEDDIQALQRELMEELGLRVQVGAHLGSSHISPPGMVLEMRVYRCEIMEGEPEAHEHADLKWIRSDEVQGLRWAPADVPLLPCFEKWFSFGN